MRRVDELVSHGERHGILGRTSQVAAPPGSLIVIFFNTLHDDQPVRVGSEDGVSAAFGRLVPIGGGCAVAPRCRFLRLIEQIGADHGGVAGISFCQHDPIIDPLRFGVVAVARDVPDIFVGEVVSLRGMTIEEDLQADLAGVGDHLVHALDGGEPLQVGIRAVVDAGGGCTASEHLVAEGNPESVEPERLYLIQHRAITPAPQPVDDLVSGLESEPIHPGDPDRIPVGIDDLIPLGGEVSVCTDGRRDWSWRRCCNG